MQVEVCSVSSNELADPLALLEESLRDGEPLPAPFVERLRGNVQSGDIEVLTAHADDRFLGVVLLAFRPNVSTGGLFASIEDLYVRPEARRRGVGRALLATVGERCRERRVSYVEVQTDDEATPFYEALGYETEEGVRVLSRYYAL